MSLEVPASKDKQHLITGVPPELGGDAVRAEVEADQQARLEELAARDQNETSLGPSTVNSVVPLEAQGPPQAEQK